jgi:inhibitor of cysteine peptidase
MRVLVPVFIAVFAAVLFTGCSRECSMGSKKVIEKDSGKTVELRIGNTLVVDLPGNPSTGYSWETVSVDGSILQSSGNDAFVPDSNMIGAPGKVSLRFKAMAAGKTALKLAYRRVWEKEVPPLKTFELNVEVAK